MIESTYVLKADSVNLPLNISEVNEHIKESFNSFDDSPYLKLLLKSIERLGESFTRRTFVNKTFTNYRYYLPERFIIKKSKLQSIESFNYIDVDNVNQTILSDNYFFTDDDDYSTVYFSDDFVYPLLNEKNYQRIIIDLVSGFGVDETFIPPDLKIAMLHHLAYLWRSKGDCAINGNVKSDFIVNSLPSSSRYIYSIYRIEDITI